MTVAGETDGAAERLAAMRSLEGEPIAPVRVRVLRQEEGRALLELMKRFPVEIACKAPVEEAIVTSGGVKVSEIEPGTMQSKRVRGLYAAGELLDVDAYTGGFNLQIAWATGRAAGLAAACEE